MHEAQILNALNALTASVANLHVMVAGIYHRIDLMQAPLSHQISSLKVSVLDTQLELNAVSDRTRALEGTVDEMNLEVLKNGMKAMEVWETVQDVKETVEKVEEVVVDVQETVDEMSGTVGEIQETVGEISSEQEEIKTTVEEVQETVNEVQEKVNEVQETVNGAQETVNEVQQFTADLPGRLDGVDKELALIRMRATNKALPPTGILFYPEGVRTHLLPRTKQQALDIDSTSS
ncbi:hypothetical protein EIP91_005444 [Steccherinum ochraceum]|uniref:t-SNARE coiled-coil homology domain-containing protein n=1 Tax=Steccherinum ochraceum TaxID=92696 RepID=A0A4R0S2C6_9APHY|nr:hypothetical protein EIP91_005444 [Steccherinum ochraceum]